MALSSHLGPSQCNDNACLPQILKQFCQGAARGIINAGDGATVDDQPADWGRRLVHKSPNLLRKKGRVRVKEISAEPIHHQTRLRHLARDWLFHPPTIGRIVKDYRGMWAITPTDVLQQRKYNREDDTGLHTDENYGSRGDQC